DARVLRALVAVVPGCATKRLAEQLLAYPARELFAAVGEVAGGSYPPWGLRGSDCNALRGDIGVPGVSPVPRGPAPAAFRARRGEGLACTDPAIRDQCGALLLLLGDAGSGSALLDWIRTEPEALGGLGADPWLLLARCSGATVREALLTRLHGAAGEDG